MKISGVNSIYNQYTTPQVMYWLQIELTCVVKWWPLSKIEAPTINFVWIKRSLNHLTQRCSRGLFLGGPFQSSLTLKDHQDRSPHSAHSHTRYQLNFNTSDFLVMKSHQLEKVEKYILILFIIELITFQLQCPLHGNHLKLASTLYFVMFVV